MQGTVTIKARFTTPEYLEENAEDVRFAAERSLEGIYRSVTFDPPHSIAVATGNDAWAGLDSAATQEALAMNPTMAAGTESGFEPPNASFLRAFIQSHLDDYITECMHDGSLIEVAQAQAIVRDFITYLKVVNAPHLDMAGQGYDGDE